MDDRKNGYYWVKSMGGAWIVAIWTGQYNKSWYIPGVERGFKDSDFEKIGDYIENKNI